MTIPTIEPAYHLWCELSNAVEDFVTGMVCVMRGDFVAAHLWFYAAKTTREEPREALIARRVEPAQPGLFEMEVAR